MNNNQRSIYVKQSIWQKAQNKLQASEFGGLIKMSKLISVLLRMYNDGEIEVEDWS